MVMEKKISLYVAAALCLAASAGQPMKFLSFNIWGDYFYMEALHRMLDPDWEMYW